MFNSEDVRVLQEAYASVYLDEAQHARENPEKYEDDEEKKMSKKERAMKDPKTGINSPAFHEFMRQQMGGGKKKKVKEEVFDAILSHLISEGYADDATSALAIMAHMSEEWRESIVEAQHARENPEKYEREENKKYEKVRGEKRPMPPRGHKDREAFEKWYASQNR